MQAVATPQGEISVFGSVDEKTLAQAADVRSRALQVALMADYQGSD
jgi:hypothetical protein